MSLCSVSEILNDAKKRGYGVPAYDVMNYETMNWVVEAAEELNIPAILMLYPEMQNMISIKQFVNMAKGIAKAASVPVSIHLDHSVDLDEIAEAIDAGFESVMYDGSKLDYEINVANTKKVVEMASAKGVNVEAELGLVGSGANVEDFKNAALYTDINQAVEFVERTGVDFLAVAIGNSHGMYIEKPNLDIERLDDLFHAVDVPLVLHGTSGIPENQLRDAVLHGITKTNIATEFFNLMGRAIDDYLKSDGRSISILDIIYKGAKPVVMDYLKQKFMLLNPNNITY